MSNFVKNSVSFWRENSNIIKICPKTDFQKHFSFTAENMYEKVQGLEEAHLRDAIQAREIQGIDVRDLKAKLAELESHKES